MNNMNNIHIQNKQINNNTIKLVAFGNEDLSYITDTVCKKILNKGYMSVPGLIEHVHFDKNKPENHNIYVSNMRNNNVMIFIKLPIESVYGKNIF